MPDGTAASRDEIDRAIEVLTLGELLKLVPRGNLTQKVVWANTGTSPTKTFTYDETGQVTSMTDA